MITTTPSRSAVPAAVAAVDRHPAVLLDLLLQTGACQSVDQAARMLVNHLAAHLRCEFVALGLCRGAKPSCRLQAISSTSQFDKRAELSRAIEAAMDEAILRDAVSVWPPTADASRHALRAHQTLAAMTHSARVVSSPLRASQGQLVGAWLFVDHAPEDGASELPALVRAGQRHVATQMALHVRCDGSRLRQWLRGARRLATGSRIALGVVAMVVIGAVLAMPVPYRIACDAQIQPMTRRFVAAPFDAPLEKALVAPGDVVSTGQTLARLDGREIRWELDGLRAELQRVAKKRDSALAHHRAAEAQLAWLERERIELRIRLLENRVRHLEIQSPIDGIVVSGDQAKAEGVPLAKGQTLLEIAPLAEMIAELGVPERDVAYVAAGGTVTLRLDAYPSRQWTVALAKIHPRAEIRDDRNVFVAECALANPHGMLRPGMNGRARIVGPRRALAWNLFHRPWERLVEACGW